MDLNIFVEKFCEQLDDTDISTVSASTNYKALKEWDSLVALSVIAMIDEEFEVVITGNDIDGNTTIENLYNTVQSRL